MPVGEFLNSKTMLTKILLTCVCGNERVVYMLSSALSGVQCDDIIVHLSFIVICCDISLIGESVSSDMQYRCCS